jgi:DNA-binding MarR family transcriptional regulator
VASDPETRDQVDEVIAASAATWPELPTGPLAVVARLGRVMSFLSTEGEAVAADFEITSAGIEALAALRVSPPPHRLSQRALGEQLMRTSGTLSVRLDRLERLGLVTREPDPYDARSVIVGLTDAGRALVDDAIAARVDAQAALLEALSTEEQELLLGLLRKLLISLDARDSGPRLGLEIAPGRAAREVRRALGLADGAGLLVRDVDADSHADRAGVAAGDMIVRANGRQLRSAAQLKRAIVSLERGGGLELTVVRGGDEVALTVVIPGRR